MGETDDVSSPPGSATRPRGTDQPQPAEPVTTTDVPAVPTPTEAEEVR